MQKSPASKIAEKCAKGHEKLRVSCVGAGYVGSLTAITMAVNTPSAMFSVCDINKELIGKW